MAQSLITKMVSVNAEYSKHPALRYPAEMFEANVISTPQFLLRHVPIPTLLFPFVFMSN